MKFLILVAAWALLLFFCWPLAILVLIAAPVVWVILLPFRFLVVCVDAMFALVKGLLWLPARLLGVKPQTR